MNLEAVMALVILGTALLAFPIYVIRLRQRRIHSARLGVDERTKQANEETGSARDHETRRFSLWPFVLILAAVLVIWNWDTLTQKAIPTFSLLSPSLAVVWGIIAICVAMYIASEIMDADDDSRWSEGLRTVAIVVMVLFFAIRPVTSWIWGDRTMSSQTQTSVLSLPANGTSRYIKVPIGHAAEYTGSQFAVHCVYRDGSEGIVGDKQQPCRNDPMLYQYVRDTSGHENSVSYEFVPM
jgi:hypothetical protein